MKKSVTYTVAFIVFLLGTSAVIAQQPDFKHLQGLRKTSYHRIDYKKLNQTYHIFVSAPDKPETGKKYPAVYLLDGGATFPMLAGYYAYLRFSEEVPDAIIIGISYGTNKRSEGNRRSRDFTAESKEHEHWGGAENFSEFLSSVLFPLVEKRYAADPERRVIFGQSLGGQFVLYAAQTKPDLFWGHIASNPALHRNLDFFLKAPPSSAKNGKPKRLFVSSGSKDEPRFRVPAMKWIEYWSKQNGAPWALKTMTLAEQSHFSAGPGAFRMGMRWVFAK